MVHEAQVAPEGRLPTLHANMENRLSMTSIAVARLEPYCHLPRPTRATSKCSWLAEFNTKRVKYQYVSEWTRACGREGHGLRGGRLELKDHILDCGDVPSDVPRDRPRV